MYHYKNDRSNSQNISKAIENLDNIINKLDLIDPYRRLHLTIKGHTFFSKPYGIFMKNWPFTRASFNR